MTFQASYRYDKARTHNVMLGLDETSEPTCDWVTLNLINRPNAMCRSAIFTTRDEAMIAMGLKLRGKVVDKGDGTYVLER
jgi:hypothetical protein